MLNPAIIYFEIEDKHLHCPFPNQDPMQSNLSDILQRQFCGLPQSSFHGQHMIPNLQSEGIVLHPFPDTILTDQQPSYGQYASVRSASCQLQLQTPYHY